MLRLADKQKRLGSVQTYHVFFLLTVVLGSQINPEPMSLDQLFKTLDKGSGFLKGEWKSIIPQQQQLNFFTNPSGFADATFLYNGLYVTIYINLLDSKYREGKQIQLISTLQNYNQTTISWSQSESDNPLMFNKQESFDLEGSGVCSANQQVQIQFDHPEKPDEYITLKGRMNSTQCNIDVSFVLNYENENYTGLILYVGFVCLISAISIWSTMYVINRVINDVTYREKLSSLPIALLTYYQWYFFALNLFSDYPYINSRIYMVVPSFCFLASYFYTVKLFVLVWRFNNFDELFDLQQRKKALLQLLFKYYLAFLVFCVLVFMFDANIWFLIGTGVFILPQIVHTAIKGRNPTFVPQFIFGILALNMFYPLYLRAYPDNFKGYQPSVLFVSIWIPLYVVQLAFLLSQQSFGSRWFVPGWVIPLPFNYFQYEAIQNEQTECYICLTDLHTDPLTDETNKTQLLTKIMQTPCKHQFHESCLKSWLTVKLECPACRKPLPILE